MIRAPSRTMFSYWGRRGALTQFTLEVARAATTEPSIAATVSVSRQNESFADFIEFGPALFPVETFRTGAGALLRSWSIPLLRKQLYERMRRDRTQLVVELLPHVWSPFVMSVARAAGARYCMIVHDADPHTGDRTAWAKILFDRPMRWADVVVTLSAAVSQRLLNTGRVPEGKLVQLFHPDFTYERRVRERVASPSQRGPIRLLFMGRILPYKGLPLFLDMIDLLRGEGIVVEIGVFGEGTLGGNAARLDAMGAEVVNRWLSESEIAATLARFHALVLPYTEASQSGVAAAALGAGLPVIATPVGGLVDQIVDGQTGMIASDVSARGLSEATKRLLLQDATYRSICDNIDRSREQRSMARFVREIVARSLL
jgi:glycosyltransferase involved in cell wall biosynthesis